MVIDQKKSNQQGKASRFFFVHQKMYINLFSINIYKHTYVPESINV